MSLRKFQLLITTLAVLLIGSNSQACNWVQVGDSDKLECRSNYKNFFGSDSESLAKILKEATYFALGSAEKVSNENWAIRNAITLPEAGKLAKNRFEAKEIVDSMNAHIRQRMAQSDEAALSDYTVPSAMMAGITIPINKELKIPALGKSFASYAANPGGSAFFGFVLLPQKVHYILDANGQISRPIPFALDEEEVDDAGLFSSIVTSVKESSDVGDGYIGYGNLRIELRFVVVPSLDIKAGVEGKFKNTKSYLKPTIGFVFGPNIMKTHQLLGRGWSGSIPGSSVRVARNILRTGKFLIPNWLVTPIERYVDTIKVGYSTNKQDPDAAGFDTDETITFGTNYFLWLRFSDRLKRIKPVAGAQGPAQSITSAILTSDKPRASAFWILSPSGDGETSNFANGMDGISMSMFRAEVTSTIKDIVNSKDDNRVVELTKELEELKDSLKDDSIADSTRGAIESRVLEIEAEIVKREKVEK